MDKIERYKKNYPAAEGEPSQFIVESSGKVQVPTWLLFLLIHSSGLKSRKKRQVKKTLKKELQKLIINYVKQRVE